MTQLRFEEYYSYSSGLFQEWITSLTSCGLYKRDREKPDSDFSVGEALSVLLITCFNCSVVPGMWINSVTPEERFPLHIKSSKDERQ